MNARYEELEEFPDYMISDEGIIINAKHGGTEIKASPNRQGLPKVTLVCDGKPYTRSMARLVAKTFVEPEREDFDTVIHLNNDRLDCRAVNLRWRPRWFAIAYHKQFYREGFRTDPMMIEDVHSGERFNSPADAVMTLGILYSDIILSFTNDSYTFPTFQKWRPVT